MSEKVYIALFASGTGSNVENILAYLEDKPDVTARVLVTNKPDCRAKRVAEEAGLDILLVDNQCSLDGRSVETHLKDLGVDWVVLAGFLRKIPASMVQAYQDRIINLHPSLLPKFGGKGMYGMRVHEAVMAAGETESGISIHLVNEQYDKGEILFQASCPIIKGDTPKELDLMIRALEFRHFPEVVYKTVKHER